MGCVISFVNTKGGVGKSFLSTSMAVWLHDEGHKVALIDADDQRTSSKWLADIENQFVEIMTLEEQTEDLRAEELRVRINQHRKNFDFIIVDTKGSAGLTTSASVIKSDIACIPIQPSAADIWPLENALSTVRLSQEVRNGLPIATLILNQVDHRDVGAKRIRNLALKYEFAVAETSVKRLRAYRDAPGLRLAPTRTDNKANNAAGALVLLFQEIVPQSNRREVSNA